MPNPLKRDPTRTTTLRIKYISDMKRRFAAVSKAIQEQVVDDDAFGLDTFALKDLLPCCLAS